MQEKLKPVGTVEKNGEEVEIMRHLGKESSGSRVKISERGRSRSPEAMGVTAARSAERARSRAARSVAASGSGASGYLS